MARCRSCGQDIRWIKTAAGKNMPCDYVPVYYREQAGAKGKIVTEDGDVLSAEINVPCGLADGLGYLSHFSTCPNADTFRRRR